MDNKIKIKLYSMLAVSIIAVTSLSGCSKDNYQPIQKPSISTKHNRFNNYAEYRLTKARGELCYKGENISILINKETNEINRFIYNVDSMKTEVYELDTGEMIFYAPLNIIELSEGYKYLKNIIENSFAFDFINIEKYLEDETCKKWYTINEIEEIEPRLLNFVIKMKNNTKVLKK